MERFGATWPEEVGLDIFSSKNNEATQAYDFEKCPRLYFRMLSLEQPAHWSLLVAVRSLQSSEHKGFLVDGLSKLSDKTGTERSHPEIMMVAVANCIYRNSHDHR